MMKRELQHGFEDVPDWKDGTLLMSTRSPEQCEFYLAWLADSLHRPKPSESPLAENDAAVQIIGIESDIAEWIWEHPFEDYPFTEQEQHPELPSHADICHRKELSSVLSRVPDKDTRVRLLDRFYSELDIDSHK